MLTVAGLAATYGVRAASPTLTSMDVGYPSYPGEMKVAGDKITVVGGGSDIWGSSDNFHYAYFRVTGDFDYVMKVESLVGNSGDGGWSKVELMARLDDGSGMPQGGDPHISNMTTRPSSDTANGAPAGVNYRGPQWRALRDDQTTWTAPNPAFPPNMPNNWVRLERVGNVFYMYTSNDGAAWSMYNPYSPQGWDTAGSWPPGTDNPAVAFFTEAWPATINLGIAVTAHYDGDVTTAVVSNFGPYTPKPIAITKQPPATVDVTKSSALKLTVEATGDPVHYQWRKNGNPIDRAVGPTFEVPVAVESDAGTYSVRVFGGGKEIISENSVVTVTVDNVAPTLVSAAADGTFTAVTVKFSEPMGASALTTGNYTLSPSVAVTAVTAVPLMSGSELFNTVKLTTAKQALNTAYTLTINNVKDLSGNTIAANSQAKFTSAKELSGFAFYERWNDADGDEGDINTFAQTIMDGTIRPADVVSTVTQFGGPWGATDNYNARVRTYFTPPSNGNYVFFVSADDNARVYLSTDDQPANKKLICQESSWSNQYQWTAPGAGTAEDKRSDYFYGTEWPMGNTITLQAGRKYFMEVLWNEGGGGDGADVTFIKEGEADPANSVDGMFMKGAVISWFESVDNLPPVIMSPTATSAVTLDQGATHTLSVVADGASSYQWQLNGRDIPGATSADYVIANAQVKDTGQYWAFARNASGSARTQPLFVLVKATGVFAIEAEDFDYDGGKSKPEASVMPYLGGAYAGLSALHGIDYFNTDAPGNNQVDGHPVYRYGGDLSADAKNATIGNETPGGQFASTRAGEWQMTTNYKIGWVGSGDWGNYTRTFPTPAKKYNVFAAGSQDSTSAGAINGSIGLVTAGVGTATQTVQPLASYTAPGTGAWSRNNVVAMTDSAGVLQTVELGGQQTIRWNYNGGDAEYLLFIPVADAPPAGAKIAWVSFHSADGTPAADAATAGFTKASDVGYTDLLKANGYSVTRIVTSGTPDVALLNTFDLVIISRSVPSGDYQDPPETLAWNGVTAPTMVMGGYIMRNSRLGYTTGGTIPDTAGSIALSVKDTAHPIFAGIALGADNTMVNNYADRVTFNGTVQRGISVNTDPVAGGGKVLATVATAGDPAVNGLVIGEWQAGATMGNAAGDKLGGKRLVFLSGSREADGLTSQGAGIFDLTSDGSKMFLNAVNYLTQPAGPEISSIKLNANGSITIEWAGGGTLQAAESVTGPWQDVPGATSPYTLTPSASKMFGRIKQ